MAFRITLKTHFSKLEVKRRYRHFRHLTHDLMMRLEGVPLPALPAKRLTSSGADSYATYDHYNTRLALQKYLIQLGALPEVWHCESFIDFVDCRDPFLGLQVQCTGLTDDVTELRVENAALGRQFCLLHQSLEDATRAITTLQRQMSELEPHSQSQSQSQREQRPSLAAPPGLDQLSPHAHSFSLPSRYEATFPS